MHRSLFLLTCCAAVYHIQSSLDNHLSTVERVSPEEISGKHLIACKCRDRKKANTLMFRMLDQYPAFASGTPPCSPSEQRRTKCRNEWICETTMSSWKDDIAAPYHSVVRTLIKTYGKNVTLDSIRTTPISTPKEGEYIHPCGKDPLLESNFTRRSPLQENSSLLEVYGAAAVGLTSGRALFSPATLIEVTPKTARLPTPRHEDRIPNASAVAEARAAEAVNPGDSALEAKAEVAESVYHIQSSLDNHLSTVDRVSPGEYSQKHLIACNCRDQKQANKLMFRLLDEYPSKDNQPCRMSRKDSVAPKGKRESRTKCRNEWICETKMSMWKDDIVEPYHWVVQDLIGKYGKNVSDSITIGPTPTQVDGEYIHPCVGEDPLLEHNFEKQKRATLQRTIEKGSSFQEKSSLLEVYDAAAVGLTSGRALLPPATPIEVMPKTARLPTPSHEDRIPNASAVAEARAAQAVNPGDSALEAKAEVAESQATRLYQSQSVLDYHVHPDGHMSSKFGAKHLVACACTSRRKANKLLLMFRMLDQFPSEKGGNPACAPSFAKNDIKCVRRWMCEGLMSGWKQDIKEEYHDAVSALIKMSGANESDLNVIDPKQIQTSSTGEGERRYIPPCKEYRRPLSELDFRRNPRNAKEAKKIQEHMATVLQRQWRSPNSTLRKAVALARQRRLKQPKQERRL